MSRCVAFWTRAHYFSVSAGATKRLVRCVAHLPLPAPSSRRHIALHYSPVSPRNPGAWHCETAWSGSKLTSRLVLMTNTRETMSHPFWVSISVLHVNLWIVRVSETPARRVESRAKSALFPYENVFVCFIFATDGTRSVAYSGFSLRRWPGSMHLFSSHKLQKSAYRPNHIFWIIIMHQKYAAQVCWQSLYDSWEIKLFAKTKLNSNYNLQNKYIMWHLHFFFVV